MMNFGFNANFGGSVKSQVTTSSSFTSNFQSATTMNVSMENQIKAQYNAQIQQWQNKFNESQAIINDLNSKLKANEGLIYESQKNWQNDKANLEANCERMRQERNTLKNQITSFQQAHQDMLRQVNSLESRVNDLVNENRVLTEKVTKYESDNSSKYEKMAQMEAQLLKAKMDMEAEQLDDADMEQTISKQREMINNLSEEVRKMQAENVKDDNTIAQLENTVRQQQDQIELLRKQNQSTLDTYTSTTTIEISQIETCDVYIELNSKYLISQAESESFKAQIDLKDRFIADLEGRVKSANEKAQIYFKTIRDLKANMETYENRELEFKKSIDEYLMKLNTITVQITTSQTKIITLESMLKSKDVQLQKYIGMIKERDAKINELKISISTHSAELASTKEVLSKKLEEISAWTKENDKDDAQIQQLIDEIRKQNETIKAWEAENAKDDKRIAELEEQVEDYQKKILTFKEFYTQLKAEFGEFGSYFSSFSVIDETMTSTTVTKLKQEVEESAAYLEVKESLNISKLEILALNKEINEYRNKITETIKDKNAILTECDDLKKQILILRKQLDTAHNLRAEVDVRFRQKMSTVESSQTSIITATKKVQGYKTTLSEKYNEIQAVFAKFEEVRR